MGYTTTRFLVPVDPNLICGICSGVLEEPVLTPCGHTFCRSCLTTWLARLGAGTCPECRAWVELNESKTIISLRNLIMAMEMTCENAARGCGEAMTVEKHELHLLSCAFTPIACAGCEVEVNRAELPYHQMECPAIQAMIDAEEDHQHKNRNLGLSQSSCKQTLSSDAKTPFAASSSVMTPQVARLMQRIDSLEKQVGRLLNDLREAYAKNSDLYLANRNLKEDFEKRLRYANLKNETLLPQNVFTSFPDVDVRTQEGIAKLSLFIAYHLLERPQHVDRDDVFYAIRRCYEFHFPGVNSRDADQYVHMLLATANTSNWFSTAQQVTLSCWLQCVLRCQGCC